MTASFSKTTKGAGAQRMGAQRMGVQRRGSGRAKVRERDFKKSQEKGEICQF